MHALHQMPRDITSHTKAKAFYAKAREWRDPPMRGARKIDDAGKPYKHIRPLGDGFAWRYHDTDVVVHMSDDLILVHPWDTISTTTFMARLLPEPLTAYLHHPIGCMIGIRHAGSSPWDDVDYYLVPQSQFALRRNGDTWDIEGAKPFEVPEVDKRVSAKVLREYQVGAFHAWVNAIYAMNDRLSLTDIQAYAANRLPEECWSHEDAHDNSDGGLDHVRDILKEPEHWWAMVASPHMLPIPRRHHGWGHRQSQFHALRSNHIKRMVKAAKLAAYRVYRDTPPLAIREVPSLRGLTAVGLAHRLRTYWEVDRFNWPVVE